MFSLEPSEAKAFQRDLAALARKYSSCSGGERYLVRLATVSADETYNGLSQPGPKRAHLLINLT